MTILLNPDTEALDDSLPRLAAARPHARRAARAAAAEPRRQRPAQRASAPRHRSARSCPPLFPAPLLPRGLRERAEPFRASGRAPSAGRSPPASRRAPRRCRRLAVRPAHPPVRRGHGAVPARPRPRRPHRLPPRARAPARRRPQRLPRGRAVRAARPPPPRGDRGDARAAAAARDDAAQALTFATRAAGQAPQRQGSALS